MKKWIGLILAICMLLGACTALCACNKDNGDDTAAPKETVMLFLGDSIAEGIAGPAPIESRAEYSYYAILGEINGYSYHNRAISGNQTHELLEYVSREEEDAYLTKTLIQEADIISISITGNDFLWNDFPAMMYELVAKDVYGEDYASHQDVKDCYIYHKYSHYTNAEGESVPLQPGDGITTMWHCLDRAYNNVSAVIDRIKTLNPDVTILMQNVYNMLDDDSELIPIDLKNALYALDPAYDYNTIAGVAKYREKAAYMLSLLSGVIERYAEEHPGRIQFVNVNKAFDDIYREDQARGSRLIFVDGLHPSDEGHAVIAATIQAKLVELGLAKADTLDAYKALCNKRLGRLYPAAPAEVSAAIQTATTMDEVTKAYFDGTSSLQPSLSTHPTEGRETNGAAVKADEVYLLNQVTMYKADEETNKLIGSVVKSLKNFFKQYPKQLVLHPDGTCEITFGLPSVSGLLGLVGMAGVEINMDGIVIGGIEDNCFMNEDGSLVGLKLAGAQDPYRALKAYANALFPGIEFGDGHLGRNFHKLYESLGITIEGLEPLTSVPYVDYDGLPLDGGSDWEVDPETIKPEGVEYESYLDYLLAYISRFSKVKDASDRIFTVDRTPLNLSEKLAEVNAITIKMSAVYSLVSPLDHEGNPHPAVYLGRYNPKTSPWTILTRTEIKDEDDEEEEAEVHLSLRIEVVGILIDFVLQQN